MHDTEYAVTIHNKDLKHFPPRTDIQYFDNGICRVYFGLGFRKQDELGNPVELTILEDKEKITSILEQKGITVYGVDVLAR